ncbi:MAG: prolyl oligopeptidase family serine peptidase [Wenzhouxiangellaceae bacterium]|nr:prolyl oligopeptidase family serine peptidase [Wenzhouxiangellaceae bacterium]
MRDRAKRCRRRPDGAAAGRAANKAGLFSAPTFSKVLLALLLAGAWSHAFSDGALDLQKIMADPDWIGPPVEAAWWQLDENAFNYRAKRDGSEQRDVYRVDLESGQVTRLNAAAQVGMDAEAPVYDQDRRRALMLRNGGLFLRDLASGTLSQLTSGSQRISSPAFSSDAQIIHYQADGQWWRMDLDQRVARPLADLQFKKAPHELADDALARDQVRLFSTLERELERQQAQHLESIDEARADPTRTPPPWYLGDKHELSASALSADGRWLLAVVQKAGADAGKSDQMPKFVTRSGYVEVEDVRSLVGRNAPVAQQLWLLDIQNRVRHEIDLDPLSGRDQDPLAELKQQQEIEPFDAENLRPVRIIGIEWHPQQPRAAIQVRSIDNKDRWTTTLDAEKQELAEVHRLTDPAWINWAFNEFGWVPGSDVLWLLSEQSGFSHLYSIDARGRLRQHTDGDFEVYGIEMSKDGRRALMITNREHPSEYDLYRLDMESGEITRITELKGLESYATHPQTRDILVRHSASYVPAQAGVVNPDSAELFGQTDTLTASYKALDWQAPQFVGVPSSHGIDEPIWSKFYPARNQNQNQNQNQNEDAPRPAVLFVHGAGYTQNTHHRFPYYFREQMFHNLLTERGYHVLDMDYRASRGYGRDWRTAIYRQMGTPELEDLVDGVAWLVKNHNVDPERIGVYGGSYGGFMSFMALFNAADTFSAGAALRPVTDWAHYNHGYTANILNTPEVDPEAYRRSSPIEFVEKLEGQLLISHGMLDDNVFYKDSVRLAQRLIELEKENWEMASYPLEPHGYAHPESWLDQYRRILKLFETSIGAQP